MTGTGPLCADPLCAIAAGAAPTSVTNKTTAATWRSISASFQRAARLARPIVTTGRSPGNSLVFPSVQFAIFFPLVLAGSWALMRHRVAWKIFVLAASYVFYAAADPRFCLLLAGVTAVNQLAAVAMARTRSHRLRGAAVTIAVMLDLVALGFFKYFGFFSDGFDRVLQDIGLGAPVPLLAVALPVGLSFFTFQAISYVVDVHRGTCEKAPFLDVAVYLAFFPHLVAGPIVRAREFLPQLVKPRDRRDVPVGAGVFLIGAGLVKKVVIADYLARHAVDPVFAVPEAYGAPDAWTALFAYAVQIFCDFSGYTDIAIGLALLMGFVFPQNFDRPYRSRSVREFWRRWHMTLSRFLRDFLYIPLGGSRGGRWRTVRNLLITMTLGGLWHGAAWGFVIWGALHGLALASEHLRRGRGEPRLPGAMRWAGTFLFVSLAWIPFRAPDLDTAWAFACRLVAPGPVTVLTPGVAAALALVLGAQLLPERPFDWLRLRVAELNPITLGAGLAATVALVAASVPGNSVPPFIYFQF
jgi:alginate O-acetyltransferase complex protein AlgI